MKPSLISQQSSRLRCTTFRARSRSWSISWREPLRFIRYHYLKLFKMMIVGFIAFTMIDYITPGLAITRCWASYRCWVCLTMYCQTPTISSGQVPYWFFGLMLQLYIVYRLLLYRRHWGWTVGLMLLCIGIQLLLGFDNPESEAMNRYRYNFMGGMLPFGLRHSVRPLWREDSDDLPFACYQYLRLRILHLADLQSESQYDRMDLRTILHLSAQCACSRFVAGGKLAVGHLQGIGMDGQSSQPPSSSLIRYPQDLHPYQSSWQTSMPDCSSTSYPASAWHGSSPN